MIAKPLFIIKRDLQKSSLTGITFENQINRHHLDEICRKITGLSDYDCRFVDNDYEDEFLSKTYNKGRLAILHYDGYVHFISFSESEIGGRNSSIQSVPTAFNIYYMCPYTRKKLYYYFINRKGNALTDYHKFVYRLMKTIGFEFLNFPYDSPVVGFVSIEDMECARNKNRNSQKANCSTFITRNENGEYEAYCNTYGANKYESSLICYAMSEINGNQKSMKLYEFLEGNLQELPKASLDVLRKMDSFEIIKTNRELEKQILESDSQNLRSPTYYLNLFNKLGDKHCALCSCNIPDIIQGAHIWPVSSIRAALAMDINTKLQHATNADNGIWLCENHHKLYDSNLIAILNDGTVQYSKTISSIYIPYLHNITENTRLPSVYLNDNFRNYINIRNSKLNLYSYVNF